MPRRTKRRAPHPEGAVATRRRPTGRPPVVADEARVKAMLEALRAGVPVLAACQRSGVSWASHQRAMDAGEQADSLHDNGQPLSERQELYRSYRADVVRARAQTVAVHVTLVAKAAHGGALAKETTRRFRNDDGEMVVETEREYTRPDWRASKFLLQTGVARSEFVERAAAALEVTGADGGPLQVAHGEEVLTTVAERLARVQAEQARQLPGGWDADAEITDAELVEEDRR